MGKDSYETSRRMHELGIRMAFGATTLDILRVAMQRSVLLSASGAVFGLAGAFAAAELMTAMVYGISPYDLVTFATAVVFVLTIAAIAAFVPAHRATTLDPLVALRCE
jgi:ABC-type antimicrobial peptide transport system permease subunit